MDVGTLAGLLEEAEDHHGAYEAVAPPHHWWDWYAAYIVSRADGHPSEQAVADAGRHMESILS
ncbi:bleomycin resistance protein [Cryptosporangium phraense]|uniref:Bleomycin resistance protein n=1 Tax=Cryptosporangium phraense TaxID=2593070 RepID=A0A545AKQ9_9ACTN|nr:bleomycin resistance protein [Cryptosporangium phraense]TQS41907.1 bleomycin resistance protein [Cryptosporangium phraense]